MAAETLEHRLCAASTPVSSHSSSAKLKVIGRKCFAPVSLLLGAESVFSCKPVLLASVILSPSEGTCEKIIPFELKHPLAGRTLLSSFPGPLGLLILFHVAGQLVVKLHHCMEPLLQRPTAASAQARA